MSSPISPSEPDRTDAIATLHHINQVAKEFREQHPDSPLCAVAYEISAMAGRLEALIKSEENSL